MRFLILIFVLVGFMQPTFASCWVPVKESRATEVWRLESENLFLRVDDDLNGDGRMDFSRFEKSCDGERIAVFAFLRLPKHGLRRYLLAEVTKSQMAAYGIRLASSGVYQSACQKGYFNCMAGHGAVSTKFKSIELFKSDGVGSIFFWDSDRQEFRRVWISD